MIIGLSGKMGSGKDLVGNIILYLTNPYDQHMKTAFTLVDKYEQGNNWQIKKFAGKLKQIVSILTGCTVEDLESQDFKDKELGEEWIRPLNTHSLTYRKLLQYIGTNAMRDVIHENIWVNALFADYIPINKIIKKSNQFDDNRLKHGYNKTRIFSIYHNMKQRCNNSNHPRFKDYGKRGIKVCPEWSESIKSFIEWSNNNGYNENLTLDRKNNDLSYNPENCRWVSYNTQATNTGLRKDNTTGYKGVSYDKKNGNRIRANIQINNKNYFLGYFNSLEEASETYEFAYLEREKLYEELEERENLIYPNIIITDMRFPNEMKAVEDRGGITIRINRDNGTRVIDTNPHPSETALDLASCKYVIDNDGTIEDLIIIIRDILIKEKIIC